MLRRFLANSEEIRPLIQAFTLYSFPAVHMLSSRISLMHSLSEAVD